MPAVKFPSEPPPTAASSSFQSICFRDLLSFFVERGDSGSSFHRHAVDATLDRELAVFVERLEGVHLAIESGGLFCILDADIDFNRGLGGDDIGARASADHAGIDRHSLLQIVELGDGGDLTGEFDDCAVSFAWIEPSVRGYALTVRV